MCLARWRRCENIKFLNSLAPPFLGVVAIFILLGIIGAGCVSSKLPKTLTKAERKLVDSVNLNYNVAVASGIFGYPNFAIKELRHSGIFNSVKHSKSISNPDLMLIIETFPAGGGGIPFWPCATLGLVPSISRTEWGYEYIIISVTEKGHIVTVDSRYTGNIVIGLAAIFLNILPSWSSDKPTTTKRYLDYLAYKIATQADNIQALIHE